MKLPLTVADYVEQWARSQNLPIPRRSTKDWEKLYLAWASRFTSASVEATLQARRSGRWS